MLKAYIGNCVDSFDENGDCINEDLPWVDVTQFAQAVEGNDNIKIGNLVVEYDEAKDIHSFYLIRQ